MQYFAFILFLALYLIPAGCLAETLSIEKAISLALMHNSKVQAIYYDRILSLSTLDVQSKIYSPKLSLEIKSTAHKEEGFESKQSELIQAYPSLHVKTPIGTQLQVLTEKSAYFSKNRHDDESITLVVKQPLMKGFSPKVNNWPITQAKLQYEMDELNFKHGIENIIANVISQFITYQMHTFQLEVQRHHFIQTKRLIETMEQKFEAGRIAEIDLLSPKLQLKQAEQNILKSQNALHKSKKELFEILGVEENNYKIADYEDIPKWKPDSNNILQEALDYDLNLKSLHQNEVKLSLESQVAKNDELFELNLQGDLHFGKSHHHRFENLTEYGYYHNLKTPNKGYTASINLSIPIGDGYLHHHKQLQINTARQKNKLDIHQRELALKNQVLNWLEEYSLQAEELSLIERQEVLAQKIYQATLEKYWTGRISVQELIRSQEKQYEVKLQKIQLKLQQQQAQLKLEQVSGNLLGNWNVKLDI